LADFFAPFFFEVFFFAMRELRDSGAVAAVIPACILRTAGRTVRSARAKAECTGSHRRSQASV
jgi:hypothetical protein